MGRSNVKAYKTYWPNPFRPWRADAYELYEYCRTSRHGMDPDLPWWEFNTRAAYWLDQLEPVRILFWKRRAAVYCLRTERFMPQFTACAGKTTIRPRPPTIRFARKRDLILFKLAWHGRES